MWPVRCIVDVGRMWWWDAPYVAFSNYDGRCCRAGVTCSLFQSAEEFCHGVSMYCDDGDLVVCHTFGDPFNKSVFGASKSEEAGALIFECDSVVKFFLIIINVSEYVVLVLVVIFNDGQVCE